MNHVNTSVIAIAGMAAGIGTLAGVAAATNPPPAPEPETFIDRANFDDPIQLNEDGIKLQTKDPTDVRFQRVTYTPGVVSGWHTHPGFVLVAVAEGTITAYDADCNEMTYGPNDVFVEYGDMTMQLANNSDADVVLLATFVVPNDAPYRIDSVSPPPCAT